MRTCASMLLLSSWSVNVLWITRATILPAAASKMHHNYLCCLSGFGSTMCNGTMALSRSQLNCTVPDAPGMHMSSFISHFLVLSATSSITFLGHLLPALLFLSPFNQEWSLLTLKLSCSFLPLSQTKSIHLFCLSMSWQGKKLTICWWEKTHQ